MFRFTQATLWRALGDVALRALHENELDALGAALWSAGKRSRSLDVASWEEKWWRERLPAAPARILVGGCGAGRELLWLIARGYQVHAFDPAPKLVDIAHERLRATPNGRRATVERLDYVGWLHSLEENFDEKRDAPFDAVLLGWGSFSHVLSASSRLAVFRACRRVCPRGPILVSWLRAATDAPPPSSLTRLARTGAFVGALRGVQRPNNDDVMMRVGATHHFPAGEVEALARAAGLRITLEEGPYPHATLRASTARSRADVADELLHDVLARRSGVIVARGQSMTPAIRSGARVRLERRSDFAHGDVVAARIGGALFIHRIVGIDGAGKLLVKGDACPGPDGWVDPSAVIGVVSGVDDRPVPPRTAPVPRWRRGVARLSRAVRALRTTT